MLFLGLGGFWPPMDTTLRSVRCFGVYSNLLIETTIYVGADRRVRQPFGLLMTESFKGAGTARVWFTGSWHLTSRQND